MFDLSFNVGPYFQLKKKTFSTVKGINLVGFTVIYIFLILILVSLETVFVGQ